MTAVAARSSWSNAFGIVGAAVCAETNMLNAFESVTLVISIVIASIACLWLLHQIWPSEQRRKHNDLIGWQISVIGTTYAVIVAFMLYAVWTNFQTADGNAEAEANCLVDMARAANGLPQESRLKIQSLARDYVNVMLTQEWPAMSRVSFSPAAVRIVEELWTTATSTETRNASEQTILSRTLAELSAMTEHRRLRLLQVTSGMPAILWTVLIVGAMITIVSACLFGSENFRLQFVEVLMLSVLLSLALVAIADIARPFQGAVHVTADAFEHARSTLDRLNR